MGCGHYLTVVVEEKRWAMSEMLSSHSPGDFRIVIGAIGGEEFRGLDRLQIVQEVGRRHA